MIFAKVGYLMRSLATSSTIKNTVELEQAEGLFPGYSASGQDVWLSYYDYDGPAIVLSAVGAQCGKTFIADGKWGTVANTTAFAIDTKKASPKFLHYMTNQKDFWEKGGSAQPYVKVSETLRKRFYIPDLATQRQIADFLDRETARIDLLIEKKQRLVALLGEREEGTFIAHVTGKNTPFEKRWSGVQWIGDIPKHWSAPKLTHVARQETGHTPSRKVDSYWVPEECVIPWISLSDVWRIRDGEEVYLSATSECISETGMANSAARLLPKDTVILSRTASVGFPAIMAFPMATTQDFAAWICSSRIRPLFLYYVLRAMKPEFRRLMMGSTHQTIYMPDIRSFRTPLPPTDEQDQIIRRLSLTIQNFRRSASALGKSIDRLREYRSALITAAVTGQLDVTAHARTGTTDRQLDRLEEMDA